MAIGLKIFFLFLLSVIITLAQENKFRRIEQHFTVYNFSTENIFPINKVNSISGYWTELNPNLPRTNYIGVSFINSDTGWAAGVGGVIIKTTNGGEDWSISNVPTSNILLKVNSYNGNTVLAAGYDGLIFRSTDAGENFYQVVSGLGDQDDLWGLQMINDTLGWVCGMNNSFVKTTDGGETWQTVSTGINTNYWWLDFLNEQTGFIACDGGVVLKTIDGGNTWQQYQAGNNFALYTIDAIDSLHIVAAGSNGKNVYSSDGGETWVENIRLIFDDVNCITFIDADSGYAIGTEWGIRKTTDRGQTWFASNINVGEWQLQLLDNYTAYCVGNGLKLNKATGTYDNWQRLVLNDGFGEIFFVNDEQGWVVGNGLYKTTNSGVDWVFQEDFPYGLIKSIDQVYFMNPDTGIVGRSPGEIELYKTTNGGNSWERKYITGLIDSIGQIRKFFFINSRTGWAVNTRGGIIKTTNGGDSWFAQLNIGISNIFTSIHFSDSSNGWISVNNGRPYRTTDSGDTWLEQTQIPFLHTSDVYFTHPDSGWILNDDDDYLYQSTDGGTNWFQVFHSPTRWARFYFFDNPDHWWLSSEHNIYETTDRGNSWNEIIVPILFSDFHSPSNAYGYACGGTGLILQYIDSSYVPVELTRFSGEAADQGIELTWTTDTEMNNYGFEIHRLNNNAWKTIGFVPGHGTTAVRHHYSFVDEINNPGIYQYRLKQIDYNGSFEYSNIIEVVVGSPTEFSLEQNYPNPFNPSTKIKFTIPTSPQSPPYQGGEAKRGWFVQLKVYDVLGNEIIALVHEEKPAGSYEVEFNSRGLTHQTLPSGIYFYRLRVGSIVETKKMVLMK